MSWSVFCACLVAALVAFSYRRLWRLKALARWAASHVARPAAPGVVSGRDAGAARRGIAELNEATIELGSKLERPGAIPRSCGRASLSLGAMAALVQAAEMLGLPASKGWQAPIISLVSGGLGALACSFIGQSAESVARQIRGDWARLIRGASEDVPKSNRGTR
jgi:hypothetical protein